MQFVALRQLKSQLRAGDLPARDVAQYVAGQAALGALLFVPSPADAPLDWDFVAFPLLALGGVLYCYRSNGGSEGLRFAERYVSLSWVVAWRIGLVVAATIALGIVAALLTSGLSWVDHERFPAVLSVATFITIAFVYWRIGVHLRDVQAREPVDARPGAA